MNSENSKTSEPYVLIFKLTDKPDLRRCEKSIALSNLSIYYTQKNIKSSYNNNKFKVSTPSWNDKFELLDGSYSVSDIQDYFEYISKTHNGQIDNPSIKIYVNKIENRITFKIKAGYYYLELLTFETMKLLGSSENKIIKNIYVIENICKRTYVQRYGFLCFAKNMGTHATKVAKNLSDKYSQKLLDTTKKSTTDAIKKERFKESNSKNSRSNW